MGYIIVALLFIFFALYMVFNAHRDTIDYRTINDDKLPKNFTGLTIFFISDVHRRKISQKTIYLIKNKIDFVAIGGDLTEKGVPLDKTRDNIRRLQAFEVPIYFVWGNHEEEIEKSVLYNMLIEEEVTVLADTNELIYRDKEVINLLGFDYHLEDQGRSKIDWGSVKEYYTILLSHVPNDFYKLDNEHKSIINTVLSGHTHGGQIRFFGLGYYENGGLTKSSHTNVLISEGYGYTMLPFRLQTKAQCHVLTFKS